LLPAPRAGEHRRADTVPGRQQESLAAAQTQAVVRLGAHAWTAADDLRGTGRAVGGGDGASQSAWPGDAQLYAGAAVSYCPSRSSSPARGTAHSKRRASARRV